MRTIDIHAHWYPAEWLSLFEKDGPKEGAQLERTPKGYTIRTERISNVFSDEFVDLGLRLEGMRRQGVDLHAVSLTAPMVHWASPGLGLALAQAYNDVATEVAVYALYGREGYNLLGNDPRETQEQAKRVSIGGKGSGAGMLLVEQMLDEYALTFGTVRVSLLNRPPFYTYCAVAEAGEELLLGAVALEEAGLAVDPVNRRLVPASSYALTAIWMRL